MGITLNENGLKRVFLQRGYGYAEFPENWPVLNEEEACRSRYVYCCRSVNAVKYGVSPFFIYFSPISYWDVPARDLECDRMDSLIMKHSKACKDAFLYHQVREKWDVDASGQRVLVNKAEVSEAFVPFHEELPVVGSKLPFGDDDKYNNIYEAHVIRPEGYDYADENRVANVSPENKWKGKYQ